ncbi:hypothetical protein IC582_024236 [Cucumis melo]
MAVPSDKYFPATVSCQVHKIDSLIKDKLTKEQLQMFEKIIFSPLLNVNMVFNSQLIHHFLLRQIPEDGNADGICFSILGKNVRFTQKEFNIITGLWPTNRTLEKDCDNKRLQSLLFGSENKKLITCLEIEEIFKNFEFTNDDDAVKVALAVFIETVMVQESGSDISIDGRDADLLMTIRDISDNLNAKSRKEKDLPLVITTLPLVSQPLALCEMASLDQTVQIHKVPPSISIVNEESQLVSIHNKFVVL